MFDMEGNFINNDNYTSGTYLLQIQNEDGFTEVTKVVKQ